MITLSIDANLIDKARLKPFTKRDGTKANYLELILIPTPNSDYGDYIVKQSVTKQERESGVNLPILGNAKRQERGHGTMAPARPSANAPEGQDAAEQTDDSIPF